VNRSCPERRDALLDHVACGTDTPDTDWERHRRACAGCRNEFERLRALQTRAFEDLAVELGEAVPGVTFEDRILAATVRRSRERFETHALPRWIVPIAAAAAVLAIVFLATRGAVDPRQASENGAASLAAWRSPTESLLHAGLGASISDLRWDRSIYPEALDATTEGVEP